MTETTTESAAESCGAWLTRELAERGWTQLHLSKVSGVPVPTIGSIMQRHTKRPRLDTVALLAQGLGYAPETVLRQLGYLEDEEWGRGDPAIAEINDILHAMPQEERQEVLRYTRMRYEYLN